jgi:hypothetical protein
LHIILSTGVWQPWEKVIKQDLDAKHGGNKITSGAGHHGSFVQKQEKKDKLV